ncbi:MAG: type II toxin-antitoxin system prevent-host-death family antitoxin [Burkholderiales bacterium]|nr:type II toxin-antitoxin system prevent-host-death family antitoxin [Opitutaceae bacterium]
MHTANIATAKTELSRLLRRVRRGERVIITDRNRPVAQLQPIDAAFAGDEAGVDAELAALHEAGVLTPPSGAALNVTAFLSAPRPIIATKQTLPAAILAEREDGR